MSEEKSGQEAEVNVVKKDVQSDVRTDVLKDVQNDVRTEVQNGVRPEAQNDVQAVQKDERPVKKASGRKPGGRRKTALIIAIAALVLLLGAGVYLVFINTSTYIAIREYLAEKHLEKGEAEEAAELYEKILNRDGTYVPAYLGEAEAYRMLEDYEAAEQVLTEGLHYAEPEKIAKLLWKVYAEHAEALLDDGDPRGALMLVNAVPVKQLTDYTGGDTKAETRLGAVWAESTLKLAQKEEDPEKAVEMLETAIDAPYNDLTDVSALEEELLDLYLTLARDSEAKDDKPLAILYYEKVLTLDPENEEAKEALERLKEVPVEIPKKLNVNLTASLTLEVNFHGIKMQIPADVTAELRYDGKTEGKEWLKGKVKLSGEFLGQELKEERSITAYQDGEDLCYRIDNGDLTRLENESLPEDLNLFLESYRELVAQSSSSRETATVNGVLCRVERKEMDGSTYVEKLPSFLQEGTIADFLGSVRLNVVRYISVSEDRVVRIEASLAEADQKSFSDIVDEFLDLGLNISLKSMDAVIDIEEEM